MNLLRGLEAVLVALVVFVCARTLVKHLRSREVSEERVRWAERACVMIPLMLYFVLRVW